MARSRSKDAIRTLLAALACGATVENAARKAGVSERTVYRRLQERAFKAQLEEVRADMVERTAGMLTGAGMNSVKTLVDIQNDASVGAAVRRRAARDVLELGVRLRELAALEQRLARLEARVTNPTPPSEKE